jgi:MoaA/NifB/PqqE/SkfB family radical SAM enzyme
MKALESPFLLRLFFLYIGNTISLSKTLRTRDRREGKGALRREKKGNKDILKEGISVKINANLILIL